MQRGFNSAFLRGRSRFVESEFDDVATSLIPAFNILIYFFRTGVLSYLTPRGGSRAPDLHRDSHPIGRLTVDAPHNKILTRSRNRDRSLT